jgi:hypothetical protein
MKFFSKFIVFILPVIFLVACTKIDTTNLGQDLIPPVDGVNTLLADTFTVTIENGLFNDTTVFNKSDEYVLGQLDGDATFGNTNASIYLQYKPQLQFAWKAKPADIISQPNQGFDSAVLCMAFNDVIYGDSAAPVKYDVWRISDTSRFRQDSNYRIAVDPGINQDVILGSSNAGLTALKIKNDTSVAVLKKDTIRYTKILRIKLNSPAAVTLFKNMLTQDTNTAFKTNTTFTDFLKGFVIKPSGSGGRSLTNYSLTSGGTRLEVWYRYKNSSGAIDTVFDSFGFNQFATSQYRCASANHIERNRAGAAINTYLTPGNDSLIFMHTTPGSYAVVNVKGIKSFPNKLIHRAELVLEEVPGFNIAAYPAPGQLYLDAVVTPLTVFKTVPRDFYLFDRFSGPADFGYFGGVRQFVNDASGNRIAQYKFNISKYMQDIVTRGEPYYDLRLFAPFDTRYYTQWTNYYDGLNISFPFPVLNRAAHGRVVLGGSNHSKYRAKLRVIYSNI